MMSARAAPRRACCTGRTTAVLRAAARAADQRPPRALSTRPGLHRCPARTRLCPPYFGRTSIGDSPFPSSLRPGPRGTGGIGVPAYRGRANLGAEAWRPRGHVVPAADDHGIHEVLMQVVYVFDGAVLGGSRYGDAVEHGQVLHQLAQADSARVRADRDAELGGQQQDRDGLVDAPDPDRVELQDIDRLRLQELLAHHPVVHVLAGSDPDRRHAPPAGCVPDTTPWPRRLLPPPKALLRHPPYH